MVAPGEFRERVDMNAPRYRARSPEPSARSRAGSSLTEVALALGLIGVLVAGAAPGLGAIRDRSAVVSARESALALVHRVRAVAIERGGADLLVDLGEHRLHALGPAGDTLSTLDLAGLGVRIETSGTADRIRLRWNALGWGVVTSRTLAFGRGGQEARLIVSSRGRASRR
jgi:type II secretory pathway pseudopilin PulG